MTGARLTLVTVSTVVPLALSTGEPLSVAVQTMLYGLPAASVKLSVPVIVAEAGFPFVGVNVRLAGFPACVIVIVSPASASVAFAVRLTAVPSACVRFAGTVITGARLTLFTVRTVVADAVPPLPSFTVHTMLYGLPTESVKFSVPVIDADLGLTPGVAANVRLAGFPVCVIVSV